MMPDFTSADFWVALLQIIGIDIILSGDNAVVIALACRSLPPQQQRIGILLGTGAAIGLRVVFAAGIVYLLAIPYLKIVGGLLLLWIAVKLLQPEENGDGQNLDGSKNLWGAVRTIAIADAVMSLDNVIGIAAAAKGSVFLLVLGLLISIPLIVWGSTLILKLLHRYPLIVTVGGALLGYVAGDVIVTDPVIDSWVVANAPFLHYLAPVVGAIGVILVGKAMARKHTAAAEQRVVEAED